jgi:hypothetical protein|tara:strand:+ start:2106 stop:2708 length:603 start_codon:yes stop_codon:yes gene_type:complete
MATVKKYNLAGVSTSLELGKQGSYITGNSSAIGFYTSGDALQKIAIANATASTGAVTKAQLDETAADLVQHVTLDLDYDTAGTSNIASVTAGSRILSVTVDIPSAWASGGAGDFVEVGDTANGSRFIRSGDIDVTKVAQYHSQYQYEYVSAGVLTAKVTNGAASAGTATVSVVMAGEATVTDYGSINNAQNSNNDLGNIA